MALRKAVAVALSSLALAGAGLTIPASAAPTGDNSRGTVTGSAPIQATGDGNDCPYERMCLYTEPNYRGKRFNLYHCDDYRLAQWNGVGSAINRQTPGTLGRFKDRYFTVIGTIAAPTQARQAVRVARVDFGPVWYVGNCW